MTTDNFFRIVANSEPLEKGWLATLRCGHKIKQDLMPALGLGIWCVECEVKGSKNGPQAERHISSPERMGETPTQIQQTSASESGAQSSKERSRKPKKRLAPASERMSKAKGENVASLFSKKDEFLAAVGSEITLLEDSNLGAAGFCLRRPVNSNSFVLAYNPDVVNNLTDIQIYGIVGHEIGRAGGWCVLEAIKKKKEGTGNETV